MLHEKRIRDRAIALLLSAAMLLTFPVISASADEGPMSRDISSLLTNGSLKLSKSTIIENSSLSGDNQYAVNESFLTEQITQLRDDWTKQKPYLDRVDGEYDRLKEFNEVGIDRSGFKITPDFIRTYFYGDLEDGTGRAMAATGVSRDTQNALNGLCDDCMKNVNGKWSMILYEDFIGYHEAEDQESKLVEYWINGKALREQANLLNNYFTVFIADEGVRNLLGNYSATISDGTEKFEAFYQKSGDPPALVNTAASRTALQELAAVVLSDSTEFTATYTKTSGGGSGGSGGSGGGSLTPQVTEKDLVPKVSVAEKGSVRGASVDADKRRIVLDIQPSGMSREQLEKVIAFTNAGTKVTYTYDKLSKDGAIATGTLLTVTTTVSGKKLSVTYTLIVAGDTNCDGKCSATDAAQIAYYYAGKIKLDENQLKAADLNNNASVNATDAAMAVAKFAQWDMATYQSKIK